MCYITVMAESSCLSIVHAYTRKGKIQPPAPQEPGTCLFPKSQVRTVCCLFQTWGSEADVLWQSNQVVLKDLTRNCNYEIVVVPFNSQGSGPPSPPVAVYVGEAVPTGEPQAVEGEAVSATEVRLRWKPPQQSQQNGDLLGYKVSNAVPVGAKFGLLGLYLEGAQFESRPGCWLKSLEVFCMTCFQSFWRNVRVVLLWYALSSAAALYNISIIRIEFNRV
jgi:hypothetical protein